MEIFRTGHRGPLPVTVDAKVKLNTSPEHRLVFTLSAGEHQIESRIAKSNPVLPIIVEPGSVTYILLDMNVASIGSVLFQGNAARNVNATLEHVRSRPDGDFKDEKVNSKELEAVSQLPNFHEPGTVFLVKDVEALSDADVREAVLQGQHTPDATTVGVLLDDLQTQFGSALQGQAVSGYTVYVYTARQWIQLQSALAKYEMRPYLAEEVPTDLRRKLLYVVAKPSKPAYLNGANMAVASDVQRVVLEEGAAKAVIQPVSLAPTSVTLNSAFRSADYHGVVASFPQPDVTKPFHLVVIGDNYRKEFTVKDKHLARLR